MATKKTDAAGKKIIVRQTRSLIGRNQEVRQTLRALGLGKIGATSEHVTSPALNGMLRRVASIIEVKTV